MKEQKDNWDSLAVDLGLGTKPAPQPEREPEAETEIPVSAEKTTAEKMTIETAVITAGAAVKETVAEDVKEKGGDNFDGYNPEGNFFGAGILNEPLASNLNPPSSVAAVQQREIQQEHIPQETIQGTQREQKKSFLGRFAKMTFFGTPAKEQPPAPGKTQRHSGKAVTSFASKTVETAAVSINRTAKPEIPVRNTTADSLPETKESDNAAENNPWGQLVSQIEARSGGPEHNGIQTDSDRKKISRRLPSMFTDEPAESKESRALKNIIEIEETREDAVERLNSIFNDSAFDRKKDIKEDEQSRYFSPRQKQREQREQRGQRENRHAQQETRRSDWEERDYPQDNHPQHNYTRKSGGKRGSKFNQRTDIDKQEFQEGRNDFLSREEQEEMPKETAERSPRTRSSRGSRTEYRQDFQERNGQERNSQERNSQERRRERRVISGHFSNENEKFISDDEERVTSIDPALIQAAKSASGWDAAISGIIDGNIRRHQSGSSNYRQNRR